jgi:ATP-dependent DNA helicase RecQ
VVVTFSALKSNDCYIIFSDVSLSEMSEIMPLTAREFLNINGVGHIKLEKYGAEFLAAINVYQENQ